MLVTRLRSHLIFKSASVGFHSWYLALVNFSFGAASLQILNALAMILCCSDSGKSSPLYKKYVKEVWRHFFVLYPVSGDRFLIPPSLSTSRTPQRGFLISAQVSSSSLSVKGKPKKLWNRLIPVTAS